METSEKDCRENIRAEKKASVIIPVYNAEKYLAEAIDSVIGQSYQPMEILLVENMSGDHSMDICRNYEKKYENIHVYEEKKAGCACARNRGMEEAEGEYIIFLDADDYLKNPDIIKKWINALEKENADIVIGNYERLWDGKLLTAAGHETFFKRRQGIGRIPFSGILFNRNAFLCLGKSVQGIFSEKTENTVL